MKNYLKESEERESAKEKEEKENHHHHHQPAARGNLEDEADQYFQELALPKDANDTNPMGYNPERVPALWNNKMREWFSFVKIDLCKKHRIDYSIPLIKEWIIYIDEINYTLKEGDLISKKNFMRSLRMFLARYNRVALDKEREAEAGMKLATKKIKEAAMKTPSQIADEQRHKKAAAKHWTNTDWEQCFEECANCIEENGKRRCACGNGIPANRRARPIPARECAQYAAKAASPRSESSGVQGG